MRRGLALAFFILAFSVVTLGVITWGGAPAAYAAPAPQGFVGVITSPKAGSAVRGTVVIEGTASHSDFWKYEVHYGRGVNPNSWVLIGDVHTAKVTNGRLEAWNTGLVPDGQYTLRLRVVRRDGNFEDFYSRDVRVANTTPTDTPTPAETPTPAVQSTATPLPAAPTVVIDQPKRDTATPAPSATRSAVAPTATPAPLPSVSGSMLLEWLWSGARLVIMVFAVLAVLVIIRVIFGYIARAIIRFVKSRLRKDDDLDD